MKDFYSLCFFTDLLMSYVLSVSEDYLIRENTFILSACFSVGLSVWQSVKSDHYRLQENRGVGLCGFDRCVSGLRSSNGIPDVPLSMPSVYVSKKVWFHFFFFLFEVSILNGMKDTLDPVPIIKLQSVKPERRVYLSRPPKAEQRVFERILLDHHCGHKRKSSERCRRWSER